MRMIITAGVAADFRALPMLPSREQRQIVHRVKDSSLRWLKAVARVRQRARDDHGHRVIEERPRYLYGDINWLFFSARVIHRLNLCEWGGTFLQTVHYQIAAKAGYAADHVNDEDG